jgi:urease accessory protein
MRKYRVANLDLRRWRRWRRWQRWQRWPGGLLILLLPAVAQAHADGSDTGLVSGLMHPVFGLDHLLAMISVGVVSAQLGGRSIWRIPAAFVGAMTAGGALGVLQFTLPHAELGIAASVLVLGMGIVLAHRHMSAWPITALVVFFGAFHDHAHGIEIPGSISPALYTLGFLLSTSVLHISGVLIGEVATRLGVLLHSGIHKDGWLTSASSGPNAPT